MVNPQINPGKFLENMFFTAEDYIVKGIPQSAIAYAIFGVAASLFAIAAAITSLAEVIARKK